MSLRVVGLGVRPLVHNARRSMKKKSTVVLDKNYLQSAPGAEIRALCARGASMPDVLFYELISNPENRDKCFRKLPEGENPLVLLPGVSDLMRFEVRNNRPCGLPSRKPAATRYQFNKKLADRTFQLDAEQQTLVAEKQAELRADVGGLVQRVEAVASMFPQLLGGRDADRKAFKESVEETIGTDREQLMQFYASLEVPALDGKAFPGAERLTTNWAIYRWLQVNLLMAVDLLYRYRLTLQDKDVMTEKVATELENDILDSQYVIVGALEGALASGDKNVRRLWRLIRAKGELNPAFLPYDVPVGLDAPRG